MNGRRCRVCEKEKDEFGKWWVVVERAELHLHEDANPAGGCGDLGGAVVNRAEDLLLARVLAVFDALDAEAHLLVLVAQAHDPAAVVVAVLAVDLQM